MIFDIKYIYNFDPYNVFLAIATNIPQRLKTGFVVQGHKCHKTPKCTKLLTYTMQLFLTDNYRLFQWQQHKQTLLRMRVCGPNLTSGRHPNRINNNS